ncbi:MAG TPA: hypothetical protein VM735_12550, partial [Candidatus Kapabacteria bacterium]|nr:hypothetical protein [Candidatus Kapabacteria bacterium]
MSVFASQANSLDLLRQMELDAEPHHYYTKVPQDRFTRLQKEINAGKVVLDRSSEKAFVTSLLRALEIPASSQMLVFSTTSLQLSLITPANPRALYFNEDTYLGFIPGGKVELVSIDPELGGIFYIMDIPRGGNSALTIDRSRRCMNCHSGSETGYVPGLTIKSVVPGTRGGSIESFRTDVTGHEIPLSERFGGWYLTGATGFTNWANAIGRMAQGELSKELLTPGERFSWSKYLVESSDLLPQMIHEHQAGFVNRAAQAAYIERIYRHQQQGKEMTANQTAEIERSAEELVKYILFSNEAALPPGGIKGDQAFKQDFLSNRNEASNGTSLRDFELNERIFRFRCSYMVYSEQFATLPKGVKGAVM